MELEDFSFPTTIDSLPCLVDSPTLWRASSGSAHPFPRHHEYEDQQSGTSTVDIQEPVVGAGDGPAGKRGGSFNLDEEKMDMLWEDFNEELLSPLHRSGRYPEKEMAGGGFWCVKSLSISKANAADGPGVVSLLKVLRKLFLIHSSGKKGQRQPAPPNPTPPCW